ncbi:MAG TPA: DUF6339 family protein [Actinocrinis sp.]|uniref:DUF6339 family protein n=1 Tax=Actinocrinis sp. TaxID=1920516 RepID=UPI002D3D98FA|nr:DUF6339 family protein [Actinocrinis sp.]HZU58338.1 DUF6339 family protein [Actinocrinis sp.]
MTTLYPRLPPGPARRLFDELKTLPSDQLRLRSAFDHPSAVYTPIGGDRATSAAIERIRDDLLRIASQAGYPTPPSIEARSGFDVAIARYLHADVGFTPAEAGSRDGGVWAHLALVTAPDIAFWRFPDPPGDRILGTDLTRHVFARLWWRAHLVFDETNPRDPYEALTVLGEAGIDQILARRKILGQSPYLFRAVLRVWRGVDRGEVTERALLQDFLKRLLRLAPFIAFEALTEEQLEAQLLALVLEAQKALSNA